MIDTSAELETSKRHLSYQQLHAQRLLEAGRGSYAQVRLELNGRLDVRRVERACDSLIARHEVLQPAETFAVCDLSALSVEVHGRARERCSEMCGTVREAAVEPFRAVLLRSSEGRHDLVLTFSPLAADAATMRQCCAEILDDYHTGRRGESDLPYADVVAWQSALLEEEDAQAGRRYWARQEAEFEPEQLPFETGEAESAAADGCRSLRIDVSGIEGALSAQPTFWLACWQALLHRLSGGTRFVTGVVAGARRYDELRDVVGPLDRTVPVPGRVRGRDSVVDTAAVLDDLLQGHVAWQEYYGDSADVTAWHAGFAHVCWPAPSASGSLVARVTNQVIDTTGARLTLVVHEQDNGGSRHIRLHYDRRAFTPAAVRSLGHRLVTLASEAAARPHASLDALPLLTASERERVLGTWSRQAAGDQPTTDSIVPWLEAQAARTPDAVAATLGDGSLTYRELHARANQLARHLREMGVGPETLVAICVERSRELLVGLLGILKAGGAYVPLDPSNPQARLSLVLADAKPRVLLTRQALIPQLPPHDATPLCLDADWPLVERQSSADLAQVATASNLAYVIYTSGSTGIPKGALITHGGLRNYIAWCLDAYGITAGAGAPLHSSVAFDLSVTSIFVPLVSGGPVTLIPEFAAGDGFARLLGDERQYGFIKLTPAHLQALALQVPPALLRARTQTVIVGGEALHGEALRVWWDAAPDLRIFNEYGPTETVVGSCVYEATAASGAGAVPIGRPIANTELYVLDRFGQPVPPGIEGELFIGGRGVARGYLNRPELTAERFVPDALAPTPGARLYRTGDVARWREDGILEYIGRGDQQVKIRGYRVELGEIEAALRQQAGVSEAVALLREDVPGERRLVAYVVASAPAAGLAIDDLQERLRGHLPDYMVPSVIVRLDGMPLNAIGKIDRRSLPAPSGERPTLTQTYAAPLTPVEATLAQVWAEVLRLERVGIHDNFFALGGDSILSLQVVARAMQLGWRFAPRQVFEHPTVAALASVARVASGQLAAQEALVGPVPLTPIQHWFFRHGLPKPHHYNQAFRMELTPAALAVLDETWVALQQHHDALRFRYTRTESGWTQTATSVDTAGRLSTIDLRGVAPAARLRLEERVTGAVQASLDLTNGPVALAVVLLTDATPPHVMLVLHHLVVDGVSWRILLADFELAGRQLQALQPVSLPPKTSSVRQWAEALRAAAASEELRAELPVWIATSAPAARLPRDRADGSNTIRASRTQLATLSREETQALLQELPARGAGQMHDALLAGLVQALAAWTDEPTWRIDLEGHGREELPGDVDVSRTVGWFTSIYPVRLTAAARPLDTLRAVKTTLRDVPQNGLGYGVLRYFGVPGAELVRDAPPAEILVNYLGQVDQVLAPAGALRPAGGPTGSMRDRGAPREYELELNAIVIGGQLRLSLIHSRSLESATTGVPDARFPARWGGVARLTDHLVGALRTLIGEALTSTEEEAVAPSDFRDLDLDESEFDRIARLLDG